MFSKKFKFNFFNKIFFYSIGITLVTLISGYFLETLFIDKFYILRKKEHILKSIEYIKKNYNDLENIKLYIDKEMETQGIDIKIINPKYNTMIMTHGMHSMEKISEITENKFKIIDFKNLGALILSYNSKLSDGNWISVTTSLSIMNAHKQEMKIFKIITIFISIILSLSLGYFFSKKITKDVEKLDKAAKEISELKFPKEIIIHRNDEIGELSKSIQKMSVQISSSIETLKSFVSNASHELKTPISVICNYAQSLKELNFDDKVQINHYSEIILNKGLQMEELVSNLLTISKIDSSAYKPQKSILNLKNIILNSLENYDFIEFEKDLIINVDIDSNYEIYSDYYLLKLSLNNIILNSLKYSKDGEIISITLKNRILTIKNVINSEISKPIQELFEPFNRGKNAENSKIEGTGLGLSIVNKSLTLLNIKYSIEIKGNYFSFLIYI